MIRRTQIHWLTPIFIIAILLSSTACYVLNPPEPTVTPSNTPIPTSTATPTSTPTITPSPTATFTPTSTFTPAPLSAEDIVAKNYLGSQILSSVEVEIVRLLIADKEVLLQGHPQVEADQIQPPRFAAQVFEGKTVVGEIILRVFNTGDEIYTLFPSELTIQIAGDQIRLEDFILAEAYISKRANPFNPDIMPGATIYLGYWFGVEGIDVPDITEVSISLEAPLERLEDGSYFGTGRYYYFQIDLSECMFEPMPDEIKQELY